jgi:hypothetical protein
VELLGWIFWGLVLFCAAGSQYYFHKAGAIQAASMSTLVNQWILVAWPLIFPAFNKLHLLWLGILTYIWGFPSTLLFVPMMRRSPRKFKHWVLVGAIAINVALLVWLTP